MCPEPNEFGMALALVDWFSFYFTKTDLIYSIVEIKTFIFQKCPIYI